MDKEKRRIALYAKIAFPKVNTKRTKFVLVDKPFIRIPHIPPLSASVFDPKESSEIFAVPFAVEELTLQKYSYRRKNRLKGFVIALAYSERLDTVYHSALQPIVRWYDTWFYQDSAPLYTRTFAP